MRMRALLHCSILLFLFSPGGCAVIRRPPVNPPLTLAEFKKELGRTEQHLHDTIKTHLFQFAEQQTALASTLTDDLAHMHETVNRLETALQSLQQTAPSQAVPSEESYAVPPQGYTPDGKLLFGATEWIWLDAADQAFQARIDSGANTSSLSAVDITIFERNGSDWVRFYMAHPTMDRRIQIESPLVKHVRVRQATTEEVERRPIVRLSMRVGDLNEKVLFTLTDRSKMEYPVMLGRSFIKDIAVVDVARTHMQPKPHRRDVR